MMNGKATALFLLLFLLIGAIMAPTSQASSYYLWDDWGGTYYDAEKSTSNSDDDLMCWAASASNILAWTGWGDVVGSVDDLFSYFQDHWTDEGGNVYFALDWWFDGESDTQGISGWSQVEEEGGGFYTDYSFSDYYWYSGFDNRAMDDSEYLLTSGYATSLGLTDGEDIGHAITLWGIEYDTDGNYEGIWITDSDDYSTTDLLQYYAVQFLSGAWYLIDYFGYSNIYITSVQGLSSIAPEAVVATAVPEPGTLILFGLGLVCFAVYAGRKKQLS